MLGIIDHGWFTNWKTVVLMEEVEKERKAMQKVGVSFRQTGS
jgi:hypothetical protein